MSAAIDGAKYDVINGSCLVDIFSIIPSHNPLLIVLSNKLTWYVL
jgi:hypothetical protein